MALFLKQQWNTRSWCYKGTIVAVKWLEPSKKPKNLYSPTSIKDLIKQYDFSLFILPNHTKVSGILKEWTKYPYKTPWATPTVACERRRIFGGHFSPPKNSVCETELQNDFCDVTTFVVLFFGQSRSMREQRVRWSPRNSCYRCY